MKSVLLLFIDGLGIGARGLHNPLSTLDAGCAAPLAHFTGDAQKSDVMLEGVCIPTDATLGCEGRPQSASGQTTILTGLNIPQILGYHKTGFPNQAMRDLLLEHSIFRQLQNLHIAPNAFINAYPPKFFAVRPRWVAATTVAVEAAGMPFRTFEDLKNYDALTHDFTNEILQENYTDIPRFNRKQAAQIIANIAGENRFTLYEYFLTDRAGHAQDHMQAERILAALAALVREVLTLVNLKETTVIITSDHGNIEDLSIRTHTRNYVPTLAWGVGRETVRRKVKDLTDITPTIIELLKEDL